MKFHTPVASYATAFIVGPLAMIALATTAKPAEAQVIGYTLGISGNNNVPTFTLTNNSTAGITLTGLTLTIGDTTKNFDAAYLEGVGATGIGFVRLSPDNNDDGAIRADFIQYTFTGFDATESFIFQGDIDADNINSMEDYRVVLFNNDAINTAPNSVITVNYSTGESLTQTMADQTPGLTAYSFNQSAAVTAAPEPGTLALMAMAAMPVAGVVLRRRRNV